MTMFPARLRPAEFARMKHRTRLKVEHRGWISPGVVGRGSGSKFRSRRGALAARVIDAPAELVREFARRLLSIPTAPCHEDGVRGEVEKICAEEGLGLELDRFGNVLVRYPRPGRGPTLVLAAHMDHPGFDVMAPPRDGKCRVRFQGGVPEDYFRKGLRIRLMPGDVPARLERRLNDAKEYKARLLGKCSVTPRFAVWDLEPCAIRGGRIIARGCDDVVGCATALAVLAQLKRMKARANVVAVLSRAEEIGFYGALALAGRQGLPRDAVVVSIETSREMPPVVMGQGAIIRVGDRASVFDPGATRFLGEVAADLQAQDRGFQFQRALMSGGTCEATAYLEHGYRATGLCVALGNYHNCGSRGRIAEEFVSFEDVRGMVRMLIASALAMPRFDEFAGRLRKRLDGLRREGERRLRARTGFSNAGR